MELIQEVDDSPLKNASRSRKDLPKQHGSSDITRIKEPKVVPPKELGTMLNPMLAPQGNGRVDLDLSPVKRMERPPLAISPTKPVPVFLSSPSKKRKSVTFSDSVMLDVPSSPYFEADDIVTPRRSILKPNTGEYGYSPMDPNNSAMWVKTSHSLLHLFSTATHSPGNPAFWQPGTIIQLEARSSDLPQLVDGCMEVLQINSFSRKFEVYATLNQVCKLNDATTLAALFAGEASPWATTVERNTGYIPKSDNIYIKDICRYVQRDVEAIEGILSLKQNPKLSPSRADPFQSRTLSQALKLIAYLLASPSVNSYISVSDIKWFYIHACELIVRPNISKSLVLPYLGIIKDCHFPAKKRRVLFESTPNPILEQILFALLNIRSFPSSSLVNEKFIALKNLVQNFPAMMAKNFHHWFGGLVLNLCDLSYPIYTKVVSVGITALLEAARNYLDNDDVCFAGRKFLESPLPSNQKSFTSENLISVSTLPLSLALDHVTESLKDLINNGHYKFAMDIWVGLTLLLGKFENGIENWKYLSRWLQVHKYCFNEVALYAKVTALSSWKVIIYKICCSDLRDLRYHLTPSERMKASENGATFSPNGKQMSKVEEILRPKIKLLIHIFVNITSVEYQRDIIDALHHSFLSIIYNLLNYQPKTNTKYLHLYWDKIIHPVMTNFYFKKDYSNAYMHRLGLGILNRLIRHSSPVTEKFGNIRCLSNETVSLNEINSISPRWIFLRFDKIIQIMVVVFRLEKLDLDAKLNCMNNFLNTIKFVTKKEVQLSDATYDLIDNIPLAMKVLVEHNQVSFDNLFKLFVGLNDTFGAANLLTDTPDIPNVYETILSKTISQMTPEQLNAIISMLYGAIGERKSLLFIFQIVRINKSLHREDLDNFIAESLSHKRFAKLSHSDMLLAGRMFEILDKNFATIAKKLIQHIVLLKAEDFEKMVDQLKLYDWNIQIFKFFISLMHDAPYDHLKQMCLRLASFKMKDEANFTDLLRFLLESNFTSEVTSLRTEIVHRLGGLSGSEKQDLLELWMAFIAKNSTDNGTLDKLLCCTFQEGFDIRYLIKNRWDTLPLLKEAWLKKSDSLYYESEEIITEAEESVQEDQQSESKKECVPAPSPEILLHDSPIDPGEQIESVALGQAALSDQVEKEVNPEGINLDTTAGEDEREYATPDPESVAVPSHSPSKSEKSSPREPLLSPPKSKLKKSSRVLRSRNKKRGSPSSTGDESIIEILSDDKAVEDVLNIPETSALDASSPNIAISEVGESHLSAEVNPSEVDSSLEALTVTEPSKDSSNAKSKNKRKAATTRQNTKRQRQEIQVKELEDSVERVPLNVLPNPLLEIVSGTDSDEKKSQSDSANSVTSFNNLSFQGQSTAVSIGSEPVTTSSCAQVRETTYESETSLSKQPLSVVEEKPLLEISSSEVVAALLQIPRLEGFGQLGQIVENMKDSDLARLSLHERYELETILMKFILRMRGVPLDP